MIASNKSFGRLAVHCAAALTACVFTLACGGVSAAASVAPYAAHEAFLTIPADLQPGDNELWITEWKDENWRYVETYRRWAAQFIASTKFFSTRESPARYPGVVLATELDGSGKVLQVSSLRGSGSDELDRFALEVGRAVSSLPALPRGLAETGKKVIVVAVVGFQFRVPGGQVQPWVSVYSIANGRYFQRLSRVLAGRFSQLSAPEKGEVRLVLGFRSGRVESLDTAPGSGSPALNEFVLREVRQMMASFPPCPGDTMVELPLAF